MSLELLVDLHRVLNMPVVGLSTLNALPLDYGFAKLLVIGHLVGDLVENILYFASAESSLVG